MTESGLILPVDIEDPDVCRKCGKSKPVKASGFGPQRWACGNCGADLENKR